MPCFRCALANVGALDAKLIRGNQVIMRRVYRGSTVSFVREHEIAASRGDAQRLRPRIESRLLDRADDARDGEVVGIARRDVRRVASELLLRGLRCGEEFADRRERLAPLLTECGADPPLEGARAMWLTG